MSSIKQKLNNIYLVGPLGSGKTSVARQLATLLNYPVYDTDSEIEERTGVEVSWIFEREGEAGFREREKAIIAELTQLSNIVLSTGGGSVIDPQNRRLLKENGVVVYLQVSVEEQLRRTLHKKHTRPLLQANDSKEKLTKLNESREAWYRDTADFIYSTDDLFPVELAREIIQDIQKLQNKELH